MRELTVEEPAPPRPEAPAAGAVLDVTVPSSWRRPWRWRRAERRWIAAFIAIPVVLFVPLAMSGHPAIVADNLLQNYPLRVLTARQIVAGHWPTWNPYSYSGTPLLAGMNAGSFFPLTFLFAILPGIVAWMLNLLAVYWCAGIGLYVLVRYLGASPLAAGLAGLAYTYCGTMVGQLVHVGVIQGQALLPWIALTQFVLARELLGARGGDGIAAALRRALPAGVVLACLVGLVCLTGEPRSIVDTEVLVFVLCACELVWHGSAEHATVRGRLAYVAATGVATGVGVAIAAAQLLPGWSYITLSERSTITYTFFGSGSMPWRWLSLFLVPGILGDNGVAHTARFFANYNLPEVTVYAGLLAVCAVFAFAGQLLGHSTAPRRRLVPFLVLCLVGLVLSMGTQSPLGPLLHHLPLFDKARLQNRNAVFFDLGAVVLLAWWVDALRSGRTAEASLRGWRRALTVAPAACALVIAAWGSISPATLAQRVATNDTPTNPSGGARPTLLIALALAVALLVIVFRDLAPRRRLRALLLVFATDLLLFNVFFQTGLISGLPSPFPETIASHRALGTYGRIAIVDPAVLSYRVNAQLGFGNLDIFTQLQSVQGYGSLVSARYAAATGARLLGTLGGCQLADGDFAQLRLASMAVSLNAFDTLPRSTPACRTPSTRIRRYFGQVLRVETVRLTGPGIVAAARSARIVLISGHGRIEAKPLLLRGAQRPSILWLAFPTAPAAAGIQLTSTRPLDVTSTTVVAKGGITEPLDTALQIGLSQPDWHLVTVIGDVSYFRHPVGPPVWLAGSPSDAEATVVAHDAYGDVTVRVTAAHPVTLVRSESWFPGWHATLRGDGTTETVSVGRRGLIQAVQVPAGTHTVAFTYDAPYLQAGLWVSAAGILAVLAAALCALGLRRRHRRA